MFGAISRLGATLCALFNEREQIKNQKNPCILKSWEPIIVNRTIKMFLTNSLKYSGNAWRPYTTEIMILKTLNSVRSNSWVSLYYTSKNKQTPPVDHRWSPGGVSSKLSCHNKICSITLSTHFFRFSLYLLFEWIVMTWLITKLSPFDVS